MKLRSYPKVFNIGHKAIEQLFLDPVIVEEKIDGSQFSFSIEDSELSFRSRGTEIFPNTTDKLFSPAVHSVIEIQNKLLEGVVYRGEVISKPKHNTIEYGRVPNKNIVLFDIAIGDENYMPYPDKLAEAARLELEVVPILFSGKIETPEQLFKFMELDSMLGGDKVEGVVVKNYERFGKDGKVLMGKYVRESFKEKHSKNWKNENPGQKDIILRLGLQLKHENRWLKAIQHLKDLGELVNEPKDIGRLIEEVKKDVLEEESDFIKDELFKWASKDIIRISASGLPEWYKKRLVESAFKTLDTEAGKEYK